MQEEELAKKQEEELQYLNQRIKEISEKEAKIPTKEARMIAEFVESKMKMLKTYYDNDKLDFTVKERIQGLIRYPQLRCFLADEEFSDTNNSRKVTLKDDIIYSERAVKIHIDKGTPKTHKKRALEFYSFYFGRYRLFFRCFGRDFLEQEKLDEEFLDDIFSPKEGDYYVSGERLEIAGATIIDEEFLDEVKAGKQFTEADFYSAKQTDFCQWYGIIHEYDIVRNGYDAFKNVIIDSFIEEKHKKVTAIVYGSGGSGKSTVLRRTAVDLHKESIHIVWVEDNNIEEFIEKGFLSIKNEVDKNEDKKFLIIIEDWYMAFTKENEKSGVDILKKAKSINNIRIVIGDRTIKKLYTDHRNNDFELHLSSEDNQQIIGKIIGKYPIWKNASEKLFNKKNDKNYKSSLFLLLFILARIDQKEFNNTSLDLAEPQQVFQKIIESDLEFIARQEKESYKGLAKALYYWSRIYNEHKIPISYETFLKIADHYNEKNTTEIYDLFSRWNADDEILDRLKLYINKNEEGRLQFNHDILAEGLSKASIEEKWKKFGTKIKIDLLNIITNKGDDYSASIFLASMLKKDRDTFADKNEKMGYIDLLLDKNNKRSYHLEMLPSVISTYAQIEKYTKTLWERELFSVSFWDFVLDSYDYSKSIKRKETIEKILSHYKIEDISLRIINKCLSYSPDISINNFLEKFLSGNYWMNTPYLFPSILQKLQKVPEIQSFAKELLSDVNSRNQEWYMISASINICNDAEFVEKFCNELLMDKNWESTNSFIIHDAIIKADKQIRSDFVSMFLKKINLDKVGFATTIICLQLCPNEKEQVRIAENLLKNKLWKKENPKGLVRLLELDILDNEIKQNFYKDILTNDNWREENSDILYKSLNLLQEDYEDLRSNFADKILKNKEYCINHESIFLLALDLSKDENLKVRSANDFIVNINLDSPRYKYVIKDLLKLTKDQKTALYYLKEWMACDWKYKDIDDKIDNYLMCFENTERVPKEIDEIIELVSKDYLDDDKMDKHWIYISSLYEKIIQLHLCGSIAWKKETDKIIKNWNKGDERYFITSVLMNYLSFPEKIKDVCSSILLNWKEEKNEPTIRFIAGYKAGTHLKIALGHPDLRELAKQTAEKILQFSDGKYYEFFDDPFIDIATQIVEKGIYPEWKIEKDLTNHCKSIQ